jgi:hypothetical protein
MNNIASRLTYIVEILWPTYLQLGPVLSSPDVIVESDELKGLTGREFAQIPVLQVTRFPDPGLFPLPHSRFARRSGRWGCVVILVAMVSWYSCFSCIQFEVVTFF